MDLQIADRVALVCSSTAGLGLATAKALAAEGCFVVVTGRRGEVARQITAGRISTDRVTSVDAHNAARTGQDETEVSAAAEAAIPIGRYGRPEEFGDVVAFLCGRQASYVTGSTVRCDGGLIATA
jgi:3-oxoacyl-[acyl-carrier protein] reductase